ncbi:MAG: hypothetical protein RJA36_3383 [Pseudomonadota bacterium]
MPTSTHPTAERLREVLSYDPATGAFTWRVTNSRRRVAGSPAGGAHKADGRVYIGIDGGLFKAHRLAWIYVHGALPPHGIDHIDGNPQNNRIANLRAATQAENMQNLRAAHRDSATGLLGVQGKRGRWIARLLVRGARFERGPFNTPQEAHEAYLALKAIHHPFATTTTNAGA